MNLTLAGSYSGLPISLTSCIGREKLVAGGYRAGRLARFGVADQGNSGPRNLISIAIPGHRACTGQGGGDQQG
jgi:hypothetical protein